MSIKTIGVVGAGQMGGGIAQVAAQAGIDVIMSDVNEDLCKKGVDTIARSLDRMVQRGRMKPEERDLITRRIRATTRLEDLAATDFVIEAIAENEEAKIELFKKLDKVCPPEVIFASNTRRSRSRGWAPAPAAPTALSGCIS